MVRFQTLRISCLAVIVEMLFESSADPFADLMNLANAHIRFRNMIRSRRFAKRLKDALWEARLRFFSASMCVGEMPPLSPLLNFQLSIR
jgi:hypothetical protein